MAYRDSCSDTGRMGDGSNAQTPSAMPNIACDFGPTSLEDQSDMGGYNRTDVPVGGTPPRSKYTSGLRGMSDYMAATTDARQDRSNNYMPD